MLAQCSLSALLVKIQVKNLGAGCARLRFKVAARGSVLALVWQGRAVERFAGGDDCEVELFEEFFRVVVLHGSAGWTVNGGDFLQG